MKKLLFVLLTSITFISCSNYSKENNIYVLQERLRWVKWHAEKDSIIYEKYTEIMGSAEAFNQLPADSQAVLLLQMLKFSHNQYGEWKEFSRKLQDGTKANR